jgi:HTH-type transcriptional regulator/antitoxin HigA
MTQQVTRQRPPGQILGQFLEERDWSQVDFAAVIQRPVQFVSEIVNGRKEITRESAAQIAAALGTSPDFWLNLQNSYLLLLQEQNSATNRELDDVRRRARLNDLVPVAALRKRGILSGRSLDELEAEVCALLDLDSIDQDPSFVLAARRANEDAVFTPTQIAWAGCVRQTAKERLESVATYSRDELKKLAERLPRLLASPDAFESLPGLFASVGVRLVYVEALAGSRMDGCAFYVGSVPVIGLSGRGKRLDKVLFTLLHEVAHLVSDHVAREDMLIESMDDDNSANSNERQADRLARHWVLPDGLPPLPARLSKPWSIETAAELGIHPIVLIGRLQREHLVPWRTPLVKGAPAVDTQLASWIM